MRFLSAKTERLFALILFSCIWVYLLIRAISVPFVFDEISTFFWYIQTGEFLPWLSKWDANNHFLNSALSYYCYKFFGLSEFSLRLPNLLFAPLMFYSIYKISGEFRNRLIAWIFILSLSCNHFFIEYLALARGYGLSMSLLMASIWFLIQLIKNDSIKYYVLSLLSVLLYLSANLTLVYSASFTLIIILFNLIIWNHEHLKSLFVKTVLLIVLGFVPLIGSVFYLFELKSLELLYYGITGSFWHVTLESLAFNSVGSNSMISPIVVFTLFVLTSIVGFYKLSKSKTVLELMNPGFVFFFLLMFNFTMVISLNYLMDIKYPEDRIGLFFIPLFLGSFLFMLDYAVNQTGSKKLITIAIPLFYLPVFFILNLNLSYTVYWKDAGVPKRFIDKVMTHKAPSDFPPSIGSDNISTNFWAIYNYMDGGNCNLINFADSMSITDDFLIANYDDNPEWRILYDSLDYDLLSDKHLLKRKLPAARVHFGDPDVINMDSLYTGSYFMFFDGYINKIPGREILATLSMALESPAKPFKGYFVFEIFDWKQELLYYSANPIQRISESWDGTPQNFNYSFKTIRAPENCFKVKIYLWNSENQPYLIRDGKLSAYYY